MSYTKRKELCLKMAYLIGTKIEIVESRYYEDNDLLQELKSNREATIVRCLCRLRTALIKNFIFVDKEIKFELKNIDTIDYFDKSDIDYLKKQKVLELKANSNASEYVNYFCELIEQNIDSIKDLFPEWVKWEYIRGLFVVPKYNKKNVMVDEYNKFKRYRTYYPYAMYIYWRPFDCRGMLLDDKEFLTSIYSLHNDKFEDRSKIIDVSSTTVNNIYNFINKGKNVVIAVDCENVDVYKLFGFIKSLGIEESKRIKKILLYDDENTVETWKLVSKHIDIPVEYIIVDRLIKKKSLVDIKMSMGISESYYKENTDSFIIVSSDSDLWGVISSLPDARFMMVYENSKKSDTALMIMNSNNIMNCSLDDFYSGNPSKLKEDILCKCVDDELKDIRLDLKSILSSIYLKSRVDANDEEKNAFYEKHLKRIKTVVGNDGILTLKMG